MPAEAWRLVERFCRRPAFDPAAIEAFARLVEDDQEEAIRRRVKSWGSKARERLSFLISATLDTVDHPADASTVLQCQGLYVTGSLKSLLPLGSKDLPKAVRVAMAKSAQGALPQGAGLIVGSRILPATWVHGFPWKQWRAALAREGPMFEQPCKVQPRQAPRSQAWMLPVFLEKGPPEPGQAEPESANGVTELGRQLASGLARALVNVAGVLPTGVTLHPLLAAAHSCWGHARMIALCAWAKSVENQARSTGRLVHVEEGPRRGSLRVLNARTRQGQAVASVSLPPASNRVG